MVTFINGFPVVHNEKTNLKQKTRYNTQRNLETKTQNHHIKDNNPEHSKSLKEKQSSNKKLSLNTLNVDKRIFKKAKE